MTKMNNKSPVTPAEARAGEPLAASGLLGDKERLDWLEKFHAVVILGGDGRTEWIHKLTANCGSLRESIDAAMSPNDKLSHDGTEI